MIICLFGNQVCFSRIRDEMQIYPSELGLRPKSTGISNNIQGLQEQDHLLGTYDIEISHHQQERCPRSFSRTWLGALWHCHPTKSNDIMISFSRFVCQDKIPKWYHSLQLSWVTLRLSWANHAATSRWTISNAPLWEKTLKLKFKSSKLFWLIYLMAPHKILLYLRLE